MAVFRQFSARLAMLGYCVGSRQPARSAFARWLLGIAVLSACWLGVAHAQVAEDDSRASQKSDLQTQMERLNDPSFRARQLARWRLQQQPRLTLELIEENIFQADHNSGAQLIDLLTVIATDKDVDLSVRAIELLRATSKRMSSVGKLADNSLQAIADIREQQAIEMLLYHSAYIGPRQFSINAKAQLGTEMSLHIGPRFTGDADTIQWIQFLSSIESVYFEGPQIDTKYFYAISQIKGLRNIKLKYCTVTNDDLRLFQQFANLEHLGLNYVDVDDSAIAILAGLPLSQSLRLYGTKISQRGADLLRKQLDDIEIYCGRGGYLGVGTKITDTEVTILTDDGGAKLAGIMLGDKLTHINDVPIKNFDDLRQELGKYLPNEKIRVRLERPGREQGTEIMDFEVSLTEDPK